MIGQYICMIEIALDTATTRAILPRANKWPDVLDNLMAYFNVIETHYVLEPKNLSVDIGCLKDLRDKIVGGLKNGDEE